MAEWVFDQLGGNKLVRGGNPSKHVVKNDLSTLARETGQNSKDQRVAKTNKPARLVYTLLELSGEDKKRFLAALDWARLSKHVEAAGTGTGGANAQLKKGVESMKSKSIRILRIEDFVTQGLIGDDFDFDQNFGLLCRSEYLTSSQSGRGGSHGLGKGVLWAFSRVSTVLFSSIPKGGDQVRLFGRSELSYHELDGIKYNAIGCFGRLEGEGADSHALSIYGNDTRVEDLRMPRDKADGTGTSIVLVDFFEPRYEQDRSLEEVAVEISESAGKWFWPSISLADQTLQISVRAEDSKGNVHFDKLVDPSEYWQPFIQAVTEKKPRQRAKEAGEIARGSLPFQVPEKVMAPEHDSFETGLTLSVLKGNPDMNDHEGANLVAVVRGAGMVVKYGPIAKPLDDMPCFGVLAAGTLLKKGKADKLSEEFFRNAEPVLHDDWELTDSIRSEYKQGAGVRLRNLWKSLNDEAMKLVDQGVKKKKQGPEALAELFPIGRSGTKKQAKKKVVTHIENSKFDGWHWVVEGELVCANFESKPWNTTIGFLADVESGRGDYMKTSQISVTPKKDVTQITVGSPTAIAVKGDTDRVKFKVKLECPEDMESADLARTRIKFSH